MSEAAPMAFVRPPIPSDRGDWLRLWRGYQAFYETDIAAATSEVVWTRLLAPTEPMRGALAFDGEHCVGLVHHIQHRSCWTVGDYCYLQDLFVDMEARGKGIGRKLIEYVYAAAAPRGCSRVYCLTHQTNSAAVQLYERVAERSGFVQYRKLLPCPQEPADGFDPSI